MRRRPTPRSTWPISAMALGEVLTFPWPLDEMGAMDQEGARALRRSMHAAAKNHRVRLRLRSTLAGLAVERIR